MLNKDDNTATAREALAAWDRLFNAREILNGHLDCGDDSSFHDPNGTVPVEIVRELEAAAIMLESVTNLIDKATGR